MPPMRVLVLAPHPDDEVLGMGGTILKLAAAGARVTCLHATVTNQFDPRALREHLRLDSLADLGYEDGQMETRELGEVIGRLRAALGDRTFDRVYLPFPGDAHSDHKVLFEAGFALAKPFRAHGAADLLCYEVPSSTDLGCPLTGPGFQPNWFEDITGHLEGKVQAFLAVYPGEALAPPAARNAETLRALARVRGAQCHRDQAEAFVLLRTVR